LVASKLATITLGQSLPITQKKKLCSWLLFIFKRMLYANNLAIKQFLKQSKELPKNDNCVKNYELGSLLNNISPV
jgi:hypothetical protein